LPKAKRITAIEKVIQARAVQIQPAFVLFCRVPAQPSSRGGAVISVAVIEEVALVIVILGGKPERVELGHWAGGAEEFTEGA